MTQSLGRRTEVSSHPDWYEMIQQLTALFLHNSTVVLLDLSLEGGVGPFNTSSAEKSFCQTCNNLPSPAPPRSCQDSHLTASQLQTL